MRIFLFLFIRRIEDFCGFGFRDNSINLKSCLGLASAPYIFTKVMKPILHSLREKGLRSVACLDDFFIIDRSYNQCLNNVSTTVHLLTSLGFKINVHKSVLIPSQSCRFLGFNFDFLHFAISIPTDRRKKLFQMTKDFLNRESCKIRLWASYIGSLISICPAV